MLMSSLHNIVKNKRELEEENIKTKPEFVEQIDIMHSKKNANIPKNISFDSKNSPIVEKQRKCSFCYKMLSSKFTLKQHVQSTHEGMKPNKCLLCDYTSSQKRTLKLHIEAVHEGKKPNKCSLCNYTCSHKQALKTHT